MFRSERVAVTAAVGSVSVGIVPVMESGWAAPVPGPSSLSICSAGEPVPRVEIDDPLGRAIRWGNHATGNRQLVEELGRLLEIDSL